MQMSWGKCELCGHSCERREAVCTLPHGPDLAVNIAPTPRFDFLSKNKMRRHAPIAGCMAAHLTPPADTGISPQKYAAGIGWRGILSRFVSRHLSHIKF